MFQSTRPRGARRRCIGGLPVPCAVSIHAPARGATRRRVESDTGRRVSIHAPARGATRRRVESDTGRRVSIHAPARGATPNHGHYERLLRFQSTRPRGARQYAPCAFHEFQTVSIHAPARGATLLGGHQYHQTEVSIHAPARGATTISILTVHLSRFQSTRPRGARHSRCNAPSH